MSRKLFAAALFVLGCTVVLYSNASAVEEAPAPREVSEKKAEGKGKFGGFDKGKFGGFGGKFDPEKFKEMKGKFGKGGFGKGGFEKGKGGFPGGKGGKKGKKKDDGDEE